MTAGQWFIFMCSDRIISSCCEFKAVWLARVSWINLGFKLVSVSLLWQVGSWNAKLMNKMEKAVILPWGLHRKIPHVGMLWWNKHLAWFFLGPPDTGGTGIYLTNRSAWEAAGVPINDQMLAESKHHRRPAIRSFRITDIWWQHMPVLIWLVLFRPAILGKCRRAIEISSVLTQTCCTVHVTLNAASVEKGVLCIEHTFIFSYEVSFSWYLCTVTRQRSWSS